MEQKKLKVFISQPMRNKTNEEIEQERNKAIKMLEERYGTQMFEVIDSFFKDAPVNSKPLWFLGKSFQLLSTADICVFLNGWNENRGCILEHLACENYKITIWEM